MANTLIQHYIRLTEFLGAALGPDYEVALHDMTKKNGSIVAIANGHISGRSIGSPLSKLALRDLRNRRYETEQSRLNFRTVSDNGKTLRSSMLFIQQQEKLVGLLSISFDDSRYQAMSDTILHLCHPESFIEQYYKFNETLVVQANRSAGGPDFAEDERLEVSIEQVAMDAVTQELEKRGVSADRLTSEERLQIIAALEKNGVFLLKSAVKDVAVGLGCSSASIYRYLTQIRKQMNWSK